MNDNAWKKFRQLCDDITAHILANPPRKPAPKRASGPRTMPDRWWEPEVNDTLPKHDGHDEPPRAA